jgi:anhydro-N-acetylmuramic acid kinase
MNNNNQPLTAIGLMSGTSLDGIDAAVLKTDGEKIYDYGKFITLPMPSDLQDRIRAMIAISKQQAASSLAHCGQLAAHDKGLERDITLLHAKAVKALGVKADVIGFHGQTIIHKPDLGFTWQMGDGALLAKETGMKVVNDFRTSDVLAGGQGAPLVPIFHAAITEDLPKPVAIVNIGGVANITWVSPTRGLLAFDTGPGNAMINDVMKKHFGKEFDENGQVAAKGQVDEDVLAAYLDNDYFRVQPPKSLDRNHFNLDLVKDLSPEDAVATLTAFTAMSIMMSNSYFNSPVPKFYITGGGRLNKRIMETLGSLAEPIENIGHNGDAFEAQAFAYLAVRVLNNLPISFPTTTGCKVSPTKNIAPIHSV